MVVDAVPLSSRTGAWPRARSTTAPASTSRSRCSAASTERTWPSWPPPRRSSAPMVRWLRRACPDVAIAIDVTYATDVPGDDPATGGHHVLGGGAAIFADRRSIHAFSSPCPSGARGEDRPHDRGRREDLHGCGRHVRLPGGDPDRARLDPASAYALADRDRAAERPRGPRRVLTAFAARVQPDETYAR